jgi:hypothetical protein
MEKAYERKTRFFSLSSLLVFSLFIFSVLSKETNLQQKDKPLISDEWVLSVLLHNQRSVTYERRLQPGPPPGGGGGPPPGGGGGGPPPGGGGGGAALPEGASISTICGTTSCTRTSTSISGNFMSRAGLTYNTSNGKFNGTLVTNGCPNHVEAYHFNGVFDAMVPVSNPVCISQTIPASSTYTTLPVAAPLRGVIGVTISGGEHLYGPMDAGFTVGQVCTDNRGICPGGTDTLMCAAWHEKVCGTKNLKGQTASTMHMLLSDCGGHAGYHNHEKLSCEYNSSSRFAGHSKMVGIFLTGQALFGMYEDTGTMPTNLDACNGHYGNTPATTVINNDGSTTTYPATTNTYHYHVTPHPPFFAGCFGPVASLSAAKALYPSCSDSVTSSCTCNPHGSSGSSCSCAEGSLLSVCTSLGSYKNYKINCPLYKHNADSMSQVNTTDPNCKPCASNCEGVAVISGAHNLHVSIFAVMITVLATHLLI